MVLVKGPDVGAIDASFLRSTGYSPLRTLGSSGPRTSLVFSSPFSLDSVSTAFFRSVFVAAYTSLCLTISRHYQREAEAFFLAGSVIPHLFLGYRRWLCS